MSAHVVTSRLEPGVSRGDSASVRKTAPSPVAAWIKHQIARERLREVVTALEAIGIPVVAVKGVVSAHTLYADVAERPMSDVDLRLRVRDFHKAVALAHQLGWPIDAHTPRLWQAEIAFPGCPVELESTLGPPGLCAMAVDELIERSTLGTRFGFPCREPELHDHALVLCLNAFKDMLRPPDRSVEDLDRILRDPRFCVDALCSLARHARVVTAVAAVMTWLLPARPNPVCRAVLEALGPLPRPRLAAAYRTVTRHRVLSPYDALVLPSIASDSHAQAIRGLGYSLYGWLEGGITRRLQPRPSSGVPAVASVAAGDGIAPRRAWLHQLARLTSGAELSLHVRGQCMQPLIASGARVRVRRARFYFPGDVLAVLDARAGVVKLHRCVGYRRHASTWCVLTQPDVGSVDGIAPALRGGAMSIADPPAPLSHVIGRVIGGECDASVISVPWRTRAKTTRVFCVRALRWLGDRTRLLPHRSTRRV